MTLTRSNVKVPINVPLDKVNIYVDNYLKVTQSTGKLFLFAGDQKIEHLNKDFYGKDIHESDANPKHLFEIASKARIGCFATQYGQITRYARDYKDVNYLVKVNSKSNIVKSEQDDPISRANVDFCDIVDLREEHGVNVVGVGYTVYIGSEYESVMISEASQLITDAHREGMIAVIWAYPRGKAVQDEKTEEIIAGAAGIAAAIGADFAKVNIPASEENPFESLKVVIQAGGRTGIITAGGSSKPPAEFFEETVKLREAGSMGNAIGRNIHQKSLDKAIRFCDAINAILYEDASAQKANEIYNS